MTRKANRQRRVLIIVENLPSPFDRRVWQEATTLRKHGYQVSIICPTGKGYEKKYEELEGVHIYRHKLPLEAEGALGYLAGIFHGLVLGVSAGMESPADTRFRCNPCLQPPGQHLSDWWFF